jgi:type IV pilus assembly protein PilB
LLALLSEELYIPTLHLDKYKFDPQIVNLVPERMAKMYGLMPLSRLGNTLTIAMSDPLNIFALDDLKTLTGCDIDIVLSSEGEVTQAIDMYYQAEGKDIENIAQSALLAKDADSGQGGLEVVREEGIELSSVLKESEKAPIVKLVDLMITWALKKRASDIHIEPEEDVVRVRYRIDGSLNDVLRIPKVNQNATLARLKIISHLDITENRIPQDGRFKVKFEGREVDFRVSCLPTTFGQKFVLRALDKTNLSIGLDKLGFSEQPLRIFKETIA